MIWDRERYISHVKFEYTGAEMFCELFGPLLPLEEEWRKQGATAKEIGMTAFDWDYVLKTGLSGHTAAVEVGGNIKLADGIDSFENRGNIVAEGFAGDLLGHVFAVQGDLTGSD